jgi:hypothetical protein
MRLALAWAVALAGLSSACVPSLTIVSWEPGKIAPHGARKIVLVDAEGRSGARRIAAQLMTHEQNGSWFRVEDRGPEGVKLTLVGQRADIAGAKAPLGDDALWGRVDVVEWDSEDTTVEDEDEEGNAMQVPAQRSEVSLQITVADRDGRVLMREEEYVGVVVVENDVVYLGDPLQEAAGVAAASFLADVSPKQVSQVVRLDDGDGELRHAIRAITEQAWTLAVAEKKLRRFLKKHAHNAIATYDLAVLVDAQGRHEDALLLYDEAMRINTRDYYVAARAGCARRATAKKAVFGEPAPRSVTPLETIPDDKPAGEAPLAPPAS